MRDLLLVDHSLKDPIFAFLGLAFAVDVLNLLAAILMIRTPRRGPFLTFEIPAWLSCLRETQIETDRERKGARGERVREPAREGGRERGKEARRDGE